MDSVANVLELFGLDRAISFNKDVASCPLYQMYEKNNRVGG
jgi:hypothetical protein